MAMLRRCKFVLGRLLCRAASMTRPAVVADLDDNAAGVSAVYIVDVSVPRTPRSLRPGTAACSSVVNRSRVSTTLMQLVLRCLCREHLRATTYFFEAPLTCVCLFSCLHSRTGGACDGVDGGSEPSLPAPRRQSIDELPVPAGQLPRQSSTPTGLRHALTSALPRLKSLGNVLERHAQSPPRHPHHDASSGGVDGLNGAVAIVDHRDTKLKPIDHRLTRVPSAGTMAAGAAASAVTAVGASGVAAPSGSPSQIATAYSSPTSTASCSPVTAPAPARVPSWSSPTTGSKRLEAHGRLVLGQWRGNRLMWMGDGSELTCDCNGLSLWCQRWLA